jgi:hypothetical protein
VESGISEMLNPLENQCFNSRTWTAPPSMEFGRILSPQLIDAASRCGLREWRMTILEP